MKIAYFAYRSYPAKGGVEYHLKLLTEFMARRGYQTTIYTSRSVSNDETNVIDFEFPFLKKRKSKPSLKYMEEIEGVRYKRFNLKFRFYNFNIMDNLYPNFKSEVSNYDIVHLHGLNNYNNYKLAKLAKSRKIPVILTCHDVSISPTYPYFLRILKKTYDRLFVRRLNKYVDYFILNTSDQINELTNIGISKDKLQVIPAGFDILKYKQGYPDEEAVLNKYNLSKQEYIFNLGRIESYKGIQDIVKIAQEIKNSTFVIAGKGSFTEKIKQLIKEKKTFNVKIFEEEFNEKEVAILLRNAKLFLFPSKKEGWGIVLVEAMSVGVPCIAYNISNVRTLLENGKSGYLVRDINEMKNKIQVLLNNHTLWEKMSKEGKKTAEEYDYHHLFQKIEDIYRKLK